LIIPGWIKIIHHGGSFYGFGCNRLGFYPKGDKNKLNFSSPLIDATMENIRGWGNRRLPRVENPSPWELHKIMSGSSNYILRRNERLSNLGELCREFKPMGFALAE
jgi:hypothetical protein